MTIPLIRSFKNVKDGCELRVSDLDDTNLDSEKGKRVHCVLVKPTDGGEMLIPKVFGDPDDDLGFQAGEVGEDLAQVLKISPFKLILYEHTVTCLWNSSYEVGPIRPNVHFLAF